MITVRIENILGRVVKFRKLQALFLHLVENVLEKGDLSISSFPTMCFKYRPEKRLIQDCNTNVARLLVKVPVVLASIMCFHFKMHEQGILKTDDLITRYFRLCTEMCVDLCYRALGEQAPNPSLIRNKCFHTLDAFVRLIALLVKHSGDGTNTITKINLLNKVSPPFSLC